MYDKQVNKGVVSEEVNFSFMNAAHWAAAESPIAPQPSNLNGLYDLDRQSGRRCLHSGQNTATEPQAATRKIYVNFKNRWPTNDFA